MEEETRIQIIKDILDTFGVFNYSIIYPLLRGESLEEFLKEKCVIYPVEYDALLTANINTFGGFADSLAGITTLIRNKQNIYNLYLKYCKYFLGEHISYVSLEIDNGGTYREFKHLDLRDEQGYINYRPYLEALGITDLQHISEQYQGQGR